MQPVRAQGEHFRTMDKTIQNEVGCSKENTENIEVDLERRELTPFLQCLYDFSLIQHLRAFDSHTTI